MSFDEFERSNYNGVPRFLYEFTLGSTRWRYCNAQASITHLGAVYQAVPVKHGEIVMSGDASADDLALNISAKADVTGLFVATPPSASLAVVIKTLHRGDTEAAVIWTGIVKSGKRVSDAEFEFNCNSLMSTLTRNGLRLTWGRGCPHALYDRGCKVDPADHGVTAQVAAVTGNTVVSAAFANYADGHFAGGFVSFTGAYGTIERRAIERHVGNTLTLLGPSDGINASAWVTAYPGCDRVTATCLNKFNNLPNYGGFPHLPNKSPFDGDPVF